MITIGLDVDGVLADYMRGYRTVAPLRGLSLPRVGSLGEFLAAVA